jgi:hypothetical protein
MNSDIGSASSSATRLCFLDTNGMFVAVFEVEGSQLGTSFRTKDHSDVI